MIDFLGVLKYIKKRPYNQLESLFAGIKSVQSSESRVPGPESRVNLIPVYSAGFLGNVKENSVGSLPEMF